MPYDAFEAPDFDPATDPPATFATASYDPSVTPPTPFSAAGVPLASIAALKAIVTVGVAIDPPVVRQVQPATGPLQAWQLQAGTDAEDLEEGIARPDDYAEATNEKIWRQVL